MHSSSQGPGDESSVLPVRRMLHLSPERSQSLSPPRHRRSHSLAEWSASAAPLWQPHEQTPSPAAPPAADQYPSHPSPQHPEQPPSSDTPASSSTGGHSQRQEHQQAHGPAIAETLAGNGGFGDVGFSGRPHSPVIRTATIDVGALMGGSSPRWHLGSPRSRLHSPTTHASADRDGSRGQLMSWLRPESPARGTGMPDAESGGPGAFQEEGTWTLQQAATAQRQVQRERAELDEIRTQLEVREARIRAQELQQMRAQSQVRTALPVA